MLRLPKILTPFALALLIALPALGAPALARGADGPRADFP